MSRYYYAHNSRQYDFFPQMGSVSTTSPTNHSTGNMETRAYFLFWSPRERGQLTAQQVYPAIAIPEPTFERIKAGTRRSTTGSRSLRPSPHKRFLPWVATNRFRISATSER